MRDFDYFMGADMDVIRAERSMLPRSGARTTYP
jgi:hypothetical protein